jgi:hypothetical protein
MRGKFINTAIGLPVATESTRINRLGSTGPLGGQFDLNRDRRLRRTRLQCVQV